MNEFELYEILCTTETVAAQYPTGKEVQKRIGRAKEAVSTRKYRIAVVGEFKKGKSSLINALVGSNLLPTNVLPTTAVVNRIVFGESRQITVCYKNGTLEKKTVEDLEHYATKLDAAKEERAAQIREIVIEYPSVFCQNRIEIIDTPGLNDDEQMSEVTWGILDEIDTALMTVSAGSPLSMTERDLIMELIARKGIRHITFVITFIDQISNRKSEQDRIIGFIRKRIQKEVREYVEECFSDSPELVQKAERLLSEPTVFAVSSVLALKGFAYDDAEILQESRFPEFKQALFDLLIAHQSMDMYEITKEQVLEAAKRLPEWHEKKLEHLREDAQTARSVWNMQQTYIRESGYWLQKKLLEMEEHLKNKGFHSGQGLCRELEEQLCREIKHFFIDQLGNIRDDTVSEQGIRKCLSDAAKAAADMMKQTQQKYKKWIHQEMDVVYREFLEWRTGSGYEEHDLTENVQHWEQHTMFPVWEWRGDISLIGASLLNSNIIAMEEEIIRRSIAEFSKKVNDYLSSWRRILLRQNAQDINTPCVPEPTEMAAMQTELCKDRFASNQKLLSDCVKAICEENRQEADSGAI